MFSQLVNHIQTNPHEQFNVIAKKIYELDNKYYTYNFKIRLLFDHPEIIEAEYFKLLKIKAKQADLFAKNILSCSYLYDTPAGFMRTIKQAAGSEMSDEIVERVLIDEAKKSIIFIQEKTTGKVRLAAINQVVKENNNYYFIGKYVFEVLKDSEKPEDQQTISILSEVLLKNASIMLENLTAFYKSGKIEETYQQYYKS
jgi:hypothetical protein